MQTKTESSKAVRVVSSVLGTLLLLGVVVGCAAWLLGGSSDSKANKADLDKQTAVVMCQQFVGDRLKAPGSAKYSGVEDTKITPTSGTHGFKVVGYVDSENSFGAKLRSDYTCVVRTTDGIEWTLSSLNILDGGR